MPRTRFVALIAGTLDAALTIAGLLRPTTPATRILIQPMIIGILVGAAPFGGLHDNVPTAPVVAISALANAVLWAAVVGGIWSFVLATQKAREPRDESNTRPPNER
jgi:hypothetical protein